MKRLDLIKEIAEKTQNALNVALPLVAKSSPAFQCFSASVPVLGVVVALANGWKEHQVKEEIVKRAISVVCKNQDITESEQASLKSSADLKKLLQKHGVSDPDIVFQRAADEEFVRIKYPELTRHLSNVDVELHKLGQLFAEIKLQLKRNFTILQPIENELEILPEGWNADEKRNPQFFRKIGPLAADFDAQTVYRRSEVDTILDLLKCGESVYISGVAASGKSVVARQTAYELRQAGWTVFMLSLKEAGYLDPHGIQTELDLVGNEHCLVVLEDAHLDPNAVNSILGARRQGWPQLLLTSRPFDPELMFRTMRNNFEHLSPIKLIPSDGFQDIITLYCNKNGVVVEQKVVDHVERVSRDSLWLLAYALKALKKGNWIKVDYDDIANEVLSDLYSLAHSLGKNNAIQTLIALSVLYRFEVLTDARYLDNIIPGSRDVLIELLKRGEVIRRRESSMELYGLPHSALANLYFEMRNEWKLDIYDDQNRYLRCYLLSDYAANGSAILKKGIFRIVASSLTLSDMKLLAQRITESDLEDADDAIRTIYCLDVTKGKALVEAFSMNCLGRKIEQMLLQEFDEPESDNEVRRILDSLFGWSWGPAKVLSVIHQITPEKSQELISAIDISVVARHVENAPRAWICASAIDEFTQANAELGRALVSHLHEARLALRFYDSASIKAASEMLERLQKSDASKAQALIAAVDWERAANLLVQLPDMSLLTKMLNCVYDIDPNLAHKIVDNIDISYIGGRMRETMEIDDIAKLIQAITGISSTTGNSIWEMLDPASMARRLVESKSLDKIGSTLESIFATCRLRANAVLENIDWAYLADRVNNGTPANNSDIEDDALQESIRNVIPIIKALAKIDQVKACEFVSMLDYNLVANRFILCSAYSFCDFILVLQGVDCAKVGDLVDALGVEFVARNIEAGSGGEAQLIKILYQYDPTKVNAIISAIDSARVAKNMSEDLNLSTDVVEAIYEINPGKAKAILDNLNIEDIADIASSHIHNLQSAIIVIGGISREKADEIVKHLDLRSIAQIFNDLENTDLELVFSIEAFDKSVGKSLWSLINLSEIVSYLVVSNKLRSLQILIEKLHETGHPQSKTVVKSLDIEIFARAIEDSKDLSLASDIKETISKVDPETASNLLNRVHLEQLLSEFDIDAFAQRLIFGDDPKDAIKYLEGVASIDKGMAQSVVDKLNLIEMSYRVADAWSLRNTGLVVECLNTIDSVKSKTLVASLNLEMILRRWTESEDPTDLCVILRAIRSVDCSKAQQLLASINMRELAERANKSKIFWASASIVIQVHRTEPTAGQELLKLMNICDLIKGIAGISDYSAKFARIAIREIEKMVPTLHEEIERNVAKFPKLKNILHDPLLVQIE